MTIKKQEFDQLRVLIEELEDLCSVRGDLAEAQGIAATEVPKVPQEHLGNQSIDKLQVALSRAFTFLNKRESVLRSKILLLCPDYFTSEGV